MLGIFLFCLIICFISRLQYSGEKRAEDESNLLPSAVCPLPSKALPDKDNSIKKRSVVSTVSTNRIKCLKKYINQLSWQELTKLASKEKLDLIHNLKQNNKKINKQNIQSELYALAVNQNQKLIKYLNYEQS